MELTHFTQNKISDFHDRLSFKHKQVFVSEKIYANKEEEKQIPQKLFLFLNDFAVE